jgi:hypothetical protein
MTKLPGAIAGARMVAERFVHSQRQQNPEGLMPLTDHIRELRDRVVKMALALAAGFVFFSQAWHVIERPLCSATIRGHSGCRTLGVNQLVLNGPLDAFYLRVKVAVIVGVILSSPIWLYQLWAFVTPDPRAVPEVAAGADLRGVPDRGHGEPEPRPAHDGDPRRSLRVAGRGGRDHRVVPRPAPGPAAPGPLYGPSRRRAVTGAVRRPGRGMSGV